MYIGGMTVTYLILSDSHGRPDRITEAIARVKPDGILFCGDGLQDLTCVDIPCPLWAVRGNCDWVSSPLILGNAPLTPDTDAFLSPEGNSILLTHGHLRGVKNDLSSLVYYAAEKNLRAVIFGHTHKPLELHLSPDADSNLPISSPLTLFNPGSLGDGGSFGTLTVRGGALLFGHGVL